MWTTPAREDLPSAARSVKAQQSGSGECGEEVVNDKGGQVKKLVSFFQDGLEDRDKHHQDLARETQQAISDLKAADSVKLESDLSSVEDATDDENELNQDTDSSSDPGRDPIGCPGEHELTYFVTPNLGECDICGGAVKRRRHVLACKTCDWWVCRSCQ